MTRAAFAMVLLLVSSAWAQKVTPERHGVLKATRTLLPDANLRVTGQACSVDNHKKMICIHETDQFAKIIFAPEDAKHFSSSTGISPIFCHGLPESHPYKPCKFDVLGALLPVAAFKDYCVVPNHEDTPCDGVPEKDRFPSGNVIALIPITYQIVTTHSRYPTWSTEYSLRLDDGHGHVGFYRIATQ